MLLLGRNKVPGWLKQGGGLYLAGGPCVCHLWSTGFAKGGKVTLGGEALISPVLSIARNLGLPTLVT